MTGRPTWHRPSPGYQPGPSCGSWAHTPGRNQPQHRRLTPRSRSAMEAEYHHRDALRLHTAEEAAAILRVKQSWLERQAADRKIPFTMLGGSYRFTSAHLEQIVR